MYGNNEVGSSKPVCSMGNNMTQFIVNDAGWTAVQSDQNKLYPTDGYETTSPNMPLTLQVDTTSPDNRPVTVFFVYTRAQSGIGNALIT